MKDIHSHVIYGIDDGSKDIEESINILKNAYEQGVTDIICTPHYIEDSKYICDNKEKLKRLNSIKKELIKNNIDINLYLGNEVYFSENLLQLIKKNKISTLNGSRYILFEFSLNNKPRHVSKEIFKLVSNGYIPILAHPERYEFFKKNPDLINKYLEMGVLLQGNYLSLYGRYGFRAKRLFKKYLKKGYYSFLGSDMHHGGDYRLDTLEKDLFKYTKDKKYVDDLLYNNFDRIINNEDSTIRRILK